MAMANMLVPLTSTVIAAKVMPAIERLDSP